MDSSEGIARRLDEAMRTGVPIPPLSESKGLNNIKTAYAIQKAWADLRTASGERIVGYKIGLTSEAIQKQLNVDQPDYGNLWDTTQYQTRDGKVEIAMNNFLQPRVEGEVAFLIGKPLRGSPDEPITPEQVLAATTACALAIEIVASRIADWKIKLVDTIADNASYGGFILGRWDKTLVGQDLAALTLRVTQNDATAAEGVGAAVMGHPAKAMAWLANKLDESGIALEPGDIVMSGALAKMLPVKQGDQFVFTLSSQPSLAVTFV